MKSCLCSHYNGAFARTVITIELKKYKYKKEKEKKHDSYA